MCYPRNRKWRTHTVDPIAVVVASQRSTNHARSALPAAPVIEEGKQTAPARPRRAAAAALRRLAVRLDPSY
jgi:hypothetical protein